MSHDSMQSLIFLYSKIAFYLCLSQSTSDSHFIDLCAGKCKHSPFPGYVQETQVLLTCQLEITSTAVVFFSLDVIQTILNMFNLLKDITCIKQKLFDLQLTSTKVISCLGCQQFCPFSNISSSHFLVGNSRSRFPVSVFIAIGFVQKQFRTYIALLGLRV